MTADRPQDDDNAAFDAFCASRLARAYREQAARLSVIEAENARLRKAFAKYASHLFDCPQHAYSNRQHLACECGLEELFLVVSPPPGSPPNA